MSDGRRPVSPHLIAAYAIAYASVWLALLTPAIVTLSWHVQHLAPRDPAGALSRVLMVGALVALVSNPLFGALSDRTRMLPGGRHPWLIGGVVGGCVSLGMIGFSTSVDGVLVGWCLAQLAFNASLSALVAVVPDHIPASQRGTVVGILGICMPFGQISGTYLVERLAWSVPLAFLVPGLIAVAGGLLLAWVLPAEPAGGDRPAAVRPAALHRGHDFSWAWISRVLFNTGSCFLQAYQPLFLLKALRLDPTQVPLVVFQSTVVQAVMVVTWSLVAGRLSDRMGRRKPFAMGGSAIQGVGLWLIAGAQSYSALLLGVGLVGMGHGIYEGVGLALATEVLPDRDHHAARDLGILNIANTLPQVMAPFVAPGILAVNSSGYLLLFGVAGALGMLGSASMACLKGAR